MNDEVESVTPMSDRLDYPQWAKETVAAYRVARPLGGSLVGEKYDHRVWLPSVVLAFLAAPVVKPVDGAIQRQLYGRKR